MAGPKKNDPKKPDPKNAAAPEEQEPDVEQVLFQGPLFDRECNLKANARLVQVALVPVKQMISDALSRRAHTILLEPREGRVAIRFVIDGVPYPAAAIPGQKGAAMVQMIKLLSGLDVNERRTAQSGGIKAEYEKIPYHLMVESAPVGGKAERIRIKVDNRKVVRQKPQEIGFPDHLKEKNSTLYGTSQRRRSDLRTTGYWRHNVGNGRTALRRSLSCIPSTIWPDLNDTRVDQCGRLSSRNPVTIWRSHSTASFVAKRTCCT